MWWSTLPGRTSGASMRMPRSTCCEAGGPRDGASTRLCTPGCSTGPSTAASRWRTDPGRSTTSIGFWYPMRRFLGTAWFLSFFLLMTQRSQGFGAIPVTSFVMVALIVVSSMFIRPQWYRSQARLKHVAPRFGELPVEGALVAGDVPRQRVTARSTLTWATLLLGITGAASVVAALLAPKVLLLKRMPGHPVSVESAVAPVGARWVVAVAILLVALGFGVLCAAVARRRLDRFLGDRPDQPSRVLRSLTTSGKASVLFCAMVIAALAWLEVSGQIVLSLSVVLGTVALLLLPGALVALMVTRGTDAPDLAGRDVWWIATRGRIPRVDLPARGLRPQTGPVPEGFVIQPRGVPDPTNPGPGCGSRGTSCHLGP
jgi:hypothetical protein